MTIKCTFIYSQLLLILLYFLKVNNLSVATYNAHGVNDVTLSYLNNSMPNIGFIVLICTYLKIKLIIYMLMAYLEWTILKSSQGDPMVDVPLYGVILCLVKLLRLVYLRVIHLTNKCVFRISLAVLFL